MTRRPLSHAAAAAAAGIALAASPLGARAGDAADEPAPVLWTADGCAGVLAQVRDAGTGNPVGGAKIAIEPRGDAGGASADSEKARAVSRADLTPLGRTSAEGTIVVAPPGARRIVVARKGWETASVEVPCTDAITVLEVNLVRLPPERAPLASAGGDAHRLLAGESLEHMAGAPRNVFQAVETLPGIARPTLGNMILGSLLGAGDLGARGARPGESRTFLDGIELPYFYHYLGFSSVVPAEMIELVDFVPSGAGPQFGRLSGGVLDIHSRALRGEDDDAPWHGRANLQLWEGNAIVRGPLAGGQLSLSDRTSIWDYLLRRDWGEGIPVWSYNDFQAVYKRPLSRGSEVSVIALGAFDDVRLRDVTPTHMRTEFYRVGSSWRRKDEDSSLRLSASWGEERFRVKLVDPDQGVQVASIRSERELRIAADGGVTLLDRLPLRAGVEAHGVEPSAGLVGDVQQQEWVIVDRIYTDRGWWAGAWTEIEVRPVETVVLIPGLRFDYDSFVGEGWFDPRFTARWFAGRSTTLSASGGLYKKPHPFSLAFADLRHLGLTEGAQVSGGVEQRFGDALVVDARVFHSTFENQVQGFDWLPDFEEFGYSIRGDGRSYGAELWSRFETSDGKNRGAVGYTFSRTDWKNVQTSREWTPSDLDATHALSLVVNRRMRKNWNGGLRLRWYTGLPYTYHDAAVFVPDGSSYVGVGANPFGRRAPSFFQLDVRIAKRWQPSPRLAIEAFADVQNVTNRANVDGYSGGKPSDPTPSMALPIFPSLGVSVVF